MNTSTSGYHITDIGIAEYDDFEIRRRKRADERFYALISAQDDLTDEARESSLATLKGRAAGMDQELQRSYRRQARSRDEADRDYESLTARIEAVKDRLSVQEFVEAVSPRTLMDQRGKNLLGHCPYHVERSPSFTIYPDGHAWCFGCHMGGDLFDIIGLVEGLDRFYDQLRYAEDFLGIVPSKRPKKTFGRRKLFQPIKIGANGRVAS